MSISQSSRSSAYFTPSEINESTYEPYQSLGDLGMNKESCGCSPSSSPSLSPSSTSLATPSLSPSIFSDSPSDRSFASELSTLFPRGQEHTVWRSDTFDYSSLDKPTGIKGKLSEIMDSFLSLFKNIVGEKDVYKAVSLYEFYFTIVFVIAIASVQNTYLGVLLLGLLSRRIPEKIIKMILSRSEGRLRNWAQRPSGASDCNMFNSGGDFSDDSGLISSHTFLISSFAFYLVFRFSNNFKNNLNAKQWTLVGFSALWIILVAFARVRLGCHKSHQTIIGIFLGIVWGYVLYIILEILKNKVPRIQEDEEKIMKLFDTDSKPVEIVQLYQ